MYDTQTGEWIEPGKEPMSAPLHHTVRSLGIAAKQNYICSI